jgi:hypothetical protein
MAPTQGELQQRLDHIDHDLDDHLRNQSEKLSELVLWLDQVNRDLNNIKVTDQEMKAIKESLRDTDQAIKDIKETLRKQRWWQKWGIPAGVITLVVSLVVAVTTFFLTSYTGWQNERNNLQRQLDTLQGPASDVKSMRGLVGQYNALIMYALQQNKLSEQEVSRFISGIPGGTPGVTVRTVQITDPSERSQAPDGTIIRGVFNSHKINGTTVVSKTCWTPGCSEGSPSDQTIWIVTQDVASNRFFPQGSWSEQAGPVLINAAGEWVSPAVYMGGTPQGGAVLINAVLVNRSGEDVFKAYLQRGEEKDKNGKPYGYPGLKRTDLPTGMEILDTVMVFRK